MDTFEKMTGIDWSGDGIVGQDPYKARMPPPPKKPGLMDEFEQWTGVDWSGDGHIGMAPPESKGYRPGRDAYTGELIAGVGITFAPNAEGYHVITAIRPNSAAMQSRRIMVGDIIYKVDQKPMQGKPTDHVVALLL